MLYTWRRQALAGDLTGAKRTPVPSFAEVEVSVPATATAGSGQIGIELPSGVRLTVDAAVDADALARVLSVLRSEEHTSELQSLMRISYAVFCLKKKTNAIKKTIVIHIKEH